MRSPSKATDPRHFRLNSWRNVHPGWITGQFTLKVQFQMEGSGMMCSWRFSFLTQHVGYHFFKGTSGDNHFRVWTLKGLARCLPALRFGILEISGFKLFTTLYGNLNTWLIHCRCLHAICIFDVHLYHWKRWPRLVFRQPPSAGGFLTWWLCPWHRSEEIRGVFTVGAKEPPWCILKKTLKSQVLKIRIVYIYIYSYTCIYCIFVYWYIYIYIFKYLHISCWVSYGFRPTSIWNFRCELQKDAVPTGK